MGVFAAPTATINLGGSISFKATDVHATVQGKITGSKEAEAVTEGAKEINLNTLTFESGKTTDVSSWANNGISFKDDGSEVTITVTITNLATDRPLYATITDTAQPVENVTRNMAIGATAYTGDVITVPKAETGKTDNIVAVTLTLDVTDPNASVAADATYGYSIVLNNEQPTAEEPEGETIYTVAEWAAMEDGKALAFTIADGEASVKGARTIIPVNPDEGRYEAEITWHTSGDVVIPSQVKDDEGNVYPVTEIEAEAFFTIEPPSSSASITSVVIPDSVTTIGNNAFQFTQIAGDLDLSNVKTIGSNAFLSCSNLTSIKLTNVETIGDYAFNGCSGVNFTFEDASKIPSNINNIGVEIITIQSGDIPAEMFKNNMLLTRLTLGSGVTSIGASAFSGCKGLLGELVLPDSVTSIGASAFSGCGGLLGELVLPDSVTSIGDSAFNGCTNLTSIDLSNVETIGASAFNGCTNLTSIDLSNVETIGASAFNGCTNLTIDTLDLTKQLKIGDAAFTGISSIEKVIVDDINNYVGKSYVGPSDNPLLLAENVYISTDLENPVTSITVPSTVTSLGYQNFYSCKWLKSISIPVTVTSFSYNTFYNCGLENIYYEGSQEQWNAISSVNDAAVPSGANIHYNQTI